MGSEALGLFAGLNVLPKKSFATDYSYRSVRDHQVQLIKTRISRRYSVARRLGSDLPATIFGFQFSVQATKLHVAIFFRDAIFRASDATCH